MRRRREFFFLCVFLFLRFSLLSTRSPPAPRQFPKNDRPHRGRRRGRGPPERAHVVQRKARQGPRPAPLGPARPQGMRLGRVPLRPLEIDPVEALGRVVRRREVSVFFFFERDGGDDDENNVRSTKKRSFDVDFWRAFASFASARTRPSLLLFSARKQTDVGHARREKRRKEKTQGHRRARENVQQSIFVFFFPGRRRLFCFHLVIGFFC